MEIDLDSESESDKEYKRVLEKKSQQVFNDAVHELMYNYGAYIQAREKVPGRKKKTLFSRRYDEILEMVGKAKKDDLKLTEEEIENLPKLQSQDLDSDLNTLKKVLNPHHEFVVSLESIEAFYDEIWVLFLVMHSNQPLLAMQAFFRIAEIELAKLKAVYAMGKAVSLLRDAGKKNSDDKSKAGSVKNKGYVSEDEVRNVAEQKSKKGMSKRSIARLVRIQLLKDESKKENPREVYSESQIRNHILK